MPPVTTRIRAWDDPRGRNLSLIVRAPRPHHPPRGHEPLHAVRRGHIIGDLARAAVFLERLLGLPATLEHSDDPYVRELFHPEVDEHGAN